MHRLPLESQASQPKSWPQPQRLPLERRSLLHRHRPRPHQNFFCGLVMIWQSYFRHHCHHRHGRLLNQTANHIHLHPRLHHCFESSSHSRSHQRVSARNLRHHYLHCHHLCCQKAHLGHLKLMNLYENLHSKALISLHHGHLQSRHHGFFGGLFLEAYHLKQQDGYQLDSS